MCGVVVFQMLCVQLLHIFLEVAGSSSGQGGQQKSPSVPETDWERDSSKYMVLSMTLTAVISTPPILDHFALL